MADESAPKQETKMKEVQGGGTEQLQCKSVPEEKSIEAAKVEKSIEAAKVEEKLEAQDKVVEGDRAVSVDEPKDATDKAGQGPSTGNGSVEEPTDVINKEDQGPPAENGSVEENPPSEEEMASLFSDLKEHEKKAFLALRAKVEEAILENRLYDNVTKKEVFAAAEEKASIKEGEEKEKPELGEGAAKEATEKEGEQVTEEKVKESIEISSSNVQVDADHGDQPQQNAELWGVPLLPSKGDKRTDVILLKFLRAKELSANEAFEMMKKTLIWRKENKIDSILEEDFGPEFDSIAYMEGKDREGHPICYNIYGTLANEQVYEKILGSEEKREKFLRWRIQLMEKCIRNLDFKPRNDGGVSTIVQVSDLKNTPLPSRKELRVALRRFVELFQDNYPEFVSRQLFINVPFWYYAFSALFAPSLTQRTKNKFVYSRSARVTDTLLKFVAAEELPAQYGGLKMDNDPDFSTEDGTKEVTIKSGSTESIEIPAPEVEHAITWDVTVSGWEVNYKEEFIPTNEKSYTIIIQRERKITWQESTMRNSFVVKEPGKVVIAIENNSFKKKRVIYRYKSRNFLLPTSSSS